MGIIQFTPNHVRQRMIRLERQFEHYEAQHLLLKERLETNRQDWFRAVREYEALERQLKRQQAQG